MRQQKISKWLKGLVILLAIMGILFFGGVTFYAFVMKQDNRSGMLWRFVFFSWYTAVLCYGVLFEFWKVCTEIGKDNSFSLKNAESFHRMGMLGVASFAGYLFRLLYLTAIGSFSFMVACYFVFLMLLSIIFFGLCEALSKLIQNAYEVKLENELTI